MATYAEPAARPQPAAAEGRSRSPLLTGHWPLLAVLVLQSVVSVAALHNSAFQDEALYLYAGRQIIHHWGGGPAPLENYAFFLSGYPYVYPVIGGFLDMVGGLALARDFSLACMLGVTTVGYLITDRLFGRRAALFAAAAYGSAGVVLFLSRLATYDPLCLLLTATASWLAMLAGLSRRPWLTLTVGPVLVLAILAKYAALIYIPTTFAMVACVALAFSGWRRAAVRLLLALAGFAISLVVAYHLMDKAAFHAISGSTTSRTVGDKAPRLGLLLEVLKLGGPVYLVALVGLVLAMRLAWQHRLIAVLLFGSSWLMPAYHVYAQEPISLDKHIGYALLFAAPLAGYALAWLSGADRKRGNLHRYDWTGAIAVIVVIASLGLSQARALYDGWPDSAALSTALHTQLRDGSGRILAEDIEVCQFDGIDVTAPWQWQSFYYPFYVDHAGKRLYGDQAIAQAIRDRYYNWVELSFIYLPGQAYFAAGQMAETRNYDLIDVIGFRDSYGSAHYYLFRSATVAGHGNFTSIAQLKING